MRFRALALALAIAVATLTVGVRLGTTEPHTPTVRSEREMPAASGAETTTFLVRYETHRQRDRARRTWRAAGAITRSVELFPGLILSGGPADPGALLRDNGAVTVTVAGNDSLQPLSDDPMRVDASSAERQQVDVYVVDSGVDWQAAGVQGHVAHGWSAHNDRATSDCAGHGTEVARTVLQSTTVSVRIVPVRVVTCDGRTSLSALILALDWISRQSGVSKSVVNASLRMRQSAPLNLAVRKLAATGARVVVSAGNDEQDACNFSPGSARAAVTVGVGSAQAGPAANGNGGPCVDIWVPMRVIEAYGGPSDGTARTSLAAAYVSGRLATTIERALSGSP